MSTGNRPSVRLRRIGSALRKAREARNLTLATASRRYGRSVGWMSTVENGRQSVSPEECGDLLDFYQVPQGPLRESLVHLAGHEHGKSWQRPLEGRLSAAALDLASLEEDSASIRDFSCTLVPGLLQTHEYARALFSIGAPTLGRNADVLFKFRMERQKILQHVEPPRLTLVISESVLLHQVGGPKVMHEQLHHLIQMATSKQVSLFILPNSKAGYLGMASSMHLLTLRPPGGLTVSVLEVSNKNLFVDDDAQVAEHEKVFERLREVSLDESGSLALIEEIASTA